MSKFRKDRFTDDGEGLVIKDKNGKVVDVKGGKDKGGKDDKDDDKQKARKAALESIWFQKG